MDGCHPPILNIPFQEYSKPDHINKGNVSLEKGAVSIHHCGRSKQKQAKNKFANSFFTNLVNRYIFFCNIAKNTIG